MDKASFQEACEADPNKLKEIRELLNSSLGTMSFTDICAQMKAATDREQLGGSIASLVAKQSLDVQSVARRFASIANPLDSITQSEAFKNAVAMVTAGTFSNLPEQLKNLGISSMPRALHQFERPSYQSLMHRIEPISPKQFKITPPAQLRVEQEAKEIEERKANLEPGQRLDVYAEFGGTEVLVKSFRVKSNSYIEAKVFDSVKTFDVSYHYTQFTLKYDVVDLLEDVSPEVIH